MLNLTCAQVRAIERVTRGHEQDSALVLRPSVEGSVILSYPGSMQFYVAPDGIITVSVQELLDYLYGER